MQKAISLRTTKETIMTTRTTWGSERYRCKYRGEKIKENCENIWRPTTVHLNEFLALIGIEQSEKIHPLIFLFVIFKVFQTNWKFFTCFCFLVLRIDSFCGAQESKIRYYYYPFDVYLFVFYNGIRTNESGFENSST